MRTEDFRLKTTFLSLFTLMFLGSFALQKYCNEEKKAFCLGTQFSDTGYICSLERAQIQFRNDWVENVGSIIQLAN